MNEQSEQLYKGAAGVAFFIGIGALLFPKTLLKVYGVKEPLSGPGVFGWRLFALRNIWTGGRALTGDPAAREMIMLLQPPDIALFLKSYRDGDIPLITTIMACITASSVMIVSAIARSKS